MKRLRSIAFLIVATVLVLAAGCATKAPPPSAPVPSEQSGISEPATQEERPTGNGVSEDVASQIFSADEIAQHATSEDCWVIVERGVYDMTSFNAHPGGREAIVRNCGKDATDVFNMRPNGTSHSEKARESLKRFQVGVVSE